MRVPMLNWLQKGANWAVAGSAPWTPSAHVNFELVHIRIQASWRCCGTFQGGPLVVVGMTALALGESMCSR